MDILARGRWCAAGALLAASMTPAVRAGNVAYEHFGTADPASEGWQVLGAGVSVTTGPAAPTAAAWFVNDQGTSDDSMRWYRIEPTAREAAAALAEGWRLRACLQVVPFEDDVDSAISLEYRDGARTFAFQLGSHLGLPMVQIVDGQGPPACDSWVGTSILIQSVGTCLETGSGFHLYEMRYDPGTDTVTVSVDAPPPLWTGYAGFVPAGSQEPRIEWGSSHGCRTGHARYARVQFFIGPVTCPWDCGGQGDEQVGIGVLLALLAGWGGGGSFCDFDGGGIGINDLLALLAAWGPCP